MKVETTMNRARHTKPKANSGPVKVLSMLHLSSCLSFMPRIIPHRFHWGRPHHLSRSGKDSAPPLPCLRPRRRGAVATSASHYQLPSTNYQSQIKSSVFSVYSVVNLNTQRATLKAERIPLPHCLPCIPWFSFNRKSINRKS